MTIRIEFEFGLEKHLVTFLGELLGKTRLNLEYNIDYPSISTRNPVVTIDGLYNSEDLEQVMLAYRKIEDIREREAEISEEVMHDYLPEVTE